MPGGKAEVPYLKPTNPGGHSLGPRKSYHPRIREASSTWHQSCRAGLARDLFLYSGSAFWMSRGWGRRWSATANCFSLNSRAETTRPSIISWPSCRRSVHRSTTRRGTRAIWFIPPPQSVPSVQREGPRQLVCPAISWPASASVTRCTASVNPARSALWRAVRAL